jgi:nitrilase
VQATPVFLDRQATLEKACDLIADAARAGARLVTFPEAFIPAYPDWVWAVPAGEKRVLDQLYAELVANSITIPGEETDRLCQVARQSKVHVVMGLNERNAEASGASLYNTLLYLDPLGNLLGKHRKLTPTGGERLVWAQGDGSTLEVYETPLGKLSGLICWENYMPLARYALYAWGTQIYVAATRDNGEPWLSTLRHIAKEGGVYVIGCGMALRKADIPERFEFKRYIPADFGEWINGGDSVIVSPAGNFIAGPLHEQEGILYAELDPALMSAGRWMLDVAGHYARPDIFDLRVDRGKRQMIRSDDAGTDELPF